MHLSFAYNKSAPEKQDDSLYPTTLAGEQLASHLSRWSHAGTHPCTRSALSLSILIVDIAPKITTAKNGFLHFDMTQGSSQKQEYRVIDNVLKLIWP